MLYNPPTGAATANDGYLGKNTAAGQQGSKVPAAAIEAGQRELVAIIVEAMLNPTNDDLKQVLKAIRSGRLTTYSDVSTTPNIITINPPTAHTALFKGLPFRIFPAYTNDSNDVKVLINGIQTSLLRRDGTPPQPKDILQGVPVDVVHDGSAVRLMSFAASEVSRNVPSLVLYVRPTTGNDQTTDGLTDAPGKAFKTLDAALLALSRFNYGASQAAIILSASEPGPVAAPQTAGSVGTTQSRLGSAGSILIQGGNGVDNQDSYVVTGTGFPGNTGIIHPSFGTNLVLRNLRADNQNPSAYNTLAVTSNATLVCERVTLSGINNTAGLFSHLYDAHGGQTRFLGGCKVVSSMPSLFKVGAGGCIAIADIFKFVGGLNFATAVLVGGGAGSNILFAGGSFDTSGGTVAGKQYQFTNNAVLDTGGLGTGALPGSTAGNTNNGAIAV